MNIWKPLVKYVPSGTAPKQQHSTKTDCCKGKILWPSQKSHNHSADMCWFSILVRQPHSPEWTIWSFPGLYPDWSYSSPIFTHSRMPSAFLLLTTYKGGSHLTSDILYDEYNINRHARKVFYPPIATAATYTLHSPAACRHRAASSTVLPVV